MKRVVITGAAGFIGANLVRRLLRDGHKVHAIVRQQSNLWRLSEIQKDIEIIRFDIRNQSHLQRNLKRIKPHWIFHLAAYGNTSTEMDVFEAIETNVLGTISLIQNAVDCGIQSFVNVGSSSEYGFKDHAPNEGEALVPNSYYALTKASASLFGRYQAFKSKVNITTLRPYAVYGPYEEKNRFIPTLIIKGLHGQLPPLVNPRIARDFIYVDDFSQACVLAACKARGEIYNVGTGTQTTIKEAVDLARGYLKIAIRPKWGSMKNRIWDTNVWVSDSRKIRRELGWAPQYSFSKGFQKTIEWFNAHPEILKFYGK